MTLIVIAAVLWYLSGAGSFLALCVFKWGEITVEDCFMIFLGGFMGPVAVLIASAHAGRSTVLWRRK